MALIFYQELLKEKSNPRPKGNRKGIIVKGKEFYIPILNTSHKITVVSCISKQSGTVSVLSFSLSVPAFLSDTRGDALIRGKFIHLSSQI